VEYHFCIVKLANTTTALISSYQFVAIEVSTKEGCRGCVFSVHI